jgi:phage head maturation protease
MTARKEALMARKLVEAGAREQRAAVLDDLEFRGADEDGKLKFRGHAAVFDEWTEIPSYFGSFMERIQRGAFRKVLSAGADVRFLINHDGLPLARTASGTMKLKEDTRGLRSTRSSRRRRSRRT